MKKMIAPILLFSLLLFGCGNKEASETNKESSSNNSLDQIIESGKIKVAVGGKYPPFNFMNEENKLDGFDADIGKEVAKRLDVEFSPITAEWDSMIAGLNGNKFDVIISSMAITDERKSKVDFVEYYSSGGVIIVEKDNNEIKGKDDLKGKVVGVALGTTFEKMAVENGAEVKTYSTSLDALTDLSHGRIEAVISDEIVSGYTIRESKFPFKVIEGRLFDEYMGIAVRKEDKELSAKIEEIIKEMQEDGTYTEISEKWFNRDIR